MGIIPPLSWHWRRAFHCAFCTCLMKWHTLWPSNMLFAKYKLLYSWLIWEQCFLLQASEYRGLLPHESAIMVRNYVSPSSTGKHSFYMWFQPSGTTREKFCISPRSMQFTSQVQVRATDQTGCRLQNAILCRSSSLQWAELLQRQRGMLPRSSGQRIY